MASLEKTLLPGETVVARGSLSPLRLYADLALIGVALAMGIIGAVLGFTVVGSIIAGVGLLVLGWGLWRLGVTLVLRRGTEMVVTSRRVLLRVGLFSKESEEMLLNKIESVEVEQALWERIANVGTVFVHGSGEGQLVYVGIAAPHEFRKACLQAVEAERAAPHSPPHSAPSTYYEVQIVDDQGESARWIEVRASSPEQARSLAAAAGVQTGEARLKRIG